MNTYSEDLEKEATSAHCPKCGEIVKGSEDGLCGFCSGEEPLDFSGASDDTEYPDR